ncbi:MAG: hypothetical protein ACRCU2_07645, partial [Planktothrix sp.]
VELREKTERKHLEMELGPVNWYDYSVCRWAVTENSIDPNDYIDLDAVADLYDISSNQFPSILCTATTIITKDGFALYSQRSSKVSDKSQTLTSCIAENIHQDFDFSSGKDCVAELPVPFKTVIRGVEEEISPGIADYLKTNNHAIFLLGLDFNIELFHPNLLFMITLPLDCEEVYEQCRQRPGRDFLEGQLKSISICPINNNDSLKDLLLNTNWISSGKASLIRSLEFLRAIGWKNPELYFEDMIEMLASGKTEISENKRKRKM